MNYVIRYTDNKGRPVRFAFVQCANEREAMDFAQRTMKGGFASVEVTSADACGDEAPVTTWPLAS